VDAFPLALLSFSFKALIALLPFLLIMKILRNYFIDRTIKALIELPDGRKERLIRLYRSAISTWRIFLWAIPFFFLLFLVLLVLLFIYPELASAVPGVDMRQLVTIMGIAWVVGITI